MNHLLRPSIYVITPGTYPLPAATTGSVEISVMQTFPYLAASYNITIIGRMQDGVLSDFSQSGLTEDLSSGKDRVKFIQVRSNIKKYPEKAIIHLPRDIYSIVQIENRPAFVVHIKNLFPLSKIWLNLHSKTFISPARIDGYTLNEAFLLADRIIVNSKFLQQHVINLVPAAQDKVFVNYPGVNHLHYTPKNDGENIPPQWASSEPVLLYIGRIIKKKGVRRLLKAMKKVITIYPAVKLYIIGSSDYTKHKNTPYIRGIEKLAARLGESVVFRPHTPNADLVKWYRRSDIFICPSIRDEAFGLVNLEAMACGVPVIATEVGGIPEVVKHNRTGLLVSLDNHVDRLAEAIISLLSNPEKAHFMGRNGRKRVLKMFTWKHTAKRLKNDYETYF